MKVCRGKTLRFTMSYKPSHHFMFQLAGNSPFSLDPPAIYIYVNNGQLTYMNGKEEEHIAHYDFHRKYSDYINELCHVCNDYCREGKSLEEITTFIKEDGESFMSYYLI